MRGYFLPPPQVWISPPAFPQQSPSWCPGGWRGHPGDGRPEPRGPAASPGASTGARLRLNELGPCLHSSVSHARYLSITALKSATCYFNGISLRNNYFPMPIIQFLFDVSLLITCRILLFRTRDLICHISNNELVSSLKKGFSAQ